MIAALTKVPLSFRAWVRGVVDGHGVDIRQVDEADRVKCEFHRDSRARRAGNEAAGEGARGKRPGRDGAVAVAIAVIVVDDADVHGVLVGIDREDLGAHALADGVCQRGSVAFLEGRAAVRDERPALDKRAVGDPDVLVLDLLDEAREGLTDLDVLPLEGAALSLAGGMHGDVDRRRLLLRLEVGEADDVGLEDAPRGDGRNIAVHLGDVELALVVVVVVVVAFVVFVAAVIVARSARDGHVGVERVHRVHLDVDLRTALWQSLARDGGRLAVRLAVCLCLATGIDGHQDEPAPGVGRRHRDDPGVELVSHGRNTRRRRNGGGVEVGETHVSDGRRLLLGQGDDGVAVVRLDLEHRGLDPVVLRHRRALLLPR